MKYITTIGIYSVFIHVFNCALMKINLNVFIIDLSMETYICLLILYLLKCIYYDFLVILCNLSVHVFIKLIYSRN